MHGFINTRLHETNINVTVFTPLFIFMTGFTYNVTSDINTLITR